MKKKLLALLLAGCMVCLTAACGTKDPGETGTSTEETAQTEETAGESALGSSTLTKLAEYKALTYKMMDTTVTDEEVETELQYLVDNSTMKNAQEEAGENSIVNIDFVGKKDGEAFEGGSAEGQELSIANSNYIEGFAESIVGMKVGETKDCPMTFPEDYGVEELNGAEVVFTITLNECWEEVPAELSDEFAVSQGYENVDALRAGVRELCELTKQQNAENDKKNQLINQLIEGSTFEISEDEVQYYYNQIVDETEMYAGYYGYDLETYVTTAAGWTMEEFETQCREDAVYRVKTSLLQKEIVKAEGIELTEEVYKKMAEEYMTYFGYATLEEFESAYTKELIENQILSDLAMEVLVEHAKAVE